MTCERELWMEFDGTHRAVPTDPDCPSPDPESIDDADGAESVRIEGKLPPSMLLPYCPWDWREREARQLLSYLLAIGYNGLPLSVLDRIPEHEWWVILSDCRDAAKGVIK